MSPSPSAGSDPGVVGVAPPPRARLALLIPWLVAALTLALLAWSAWPALRPLRTVEVTQAVFDRAAPTARVEVAGSEAPGAPRASGGVAVQAPGWLEAEPYFIACTALADGVVERIEVLEGDRVEAGQVVAHLVDEDARLRLGRAEAQLAAARASLDMADVELEAAQTDWDEPVEQERAVESGRAALSSARAELAQLPSLIDEAQATLVRLREELAFAERYRANEAATELELVTARQDVAAQEGRVAALEARRPMLEAEVERRAAELRAAERNLALRVSERRRLAAAKVARAQAEAMLAEAQVARDEAALELERMTIRAPIDGFVQARLRAPGDKVARMMDDPHSAHIAHIYDPRRIQVRVDVPLADAAHVFVGQACEVVVEVLPDRTFAGEVLRVTHQADLQKNTLQVKVKVKDPDPLLRPEMLTRVKFLPRTAGAAVTEGAKPRGRGTGGETRVLVPLDAMTPAGEVWTVRERRGDRGVLRPVPVTVIGQAEAWATVTGALQPGDLLVAQPVEMDAGKRVRFRRLGEGGVS